MQKYKVIMSDPPWQYSDKAAAGRRGADFQYPTMSVREIQALPVRRFADEDCALFLWTTMPFIPEAIKVMKSWGFTYKTVAFTWVKRTKHGKLFWGMGSWTRANPEICLLGVKGKPKPISHAVHSVCEAKVRKHSQKPDEIRDSIVKLMGDVPRLEMFARQTTDGWDAWGNQVDDSVEIAPQTGLDLARALRKK